jgi:acyl carrier protein
MSFLEFIADLMGVENDVINMNTEYASISEWDSLMQLRIVAELEETYNVVIPLDKIPEIKRLSQFYEYVKDNFSS